MYAKVHDDAYELDWTSSDKKSKQKIENFEDLLLRLEAKIKNHKTDLDAAFAIFAELPQSKSSYDAIHFFNKSVRKYIQHNLSGKSEQERMQIVVNHMIKDAKVRVRAKREKADGSHFYHTRYILLLESKWQKNSGVMLGEDALNDITDIMNIEPHLKQAKIRIAKNGRQQLEVVFS